MTIPLLTRPWSWLAALAALALVASLTAGSSAVFSTSSSLNATFSGGLLRLTSDRSGAAVLSGGAMRPGDTRQGVLTLTNTGTVTSVLTLGAAGAPSDVPASPSLSSTLRLTVESCSAATLACPGASTLFPVLPSAPSLRDFTAVTGGIGLGPLGSAQQRFFRFTLTWPAASSDPNLQAASTAITIQWRTEAHA